MSVTIEVAHALPGRLRLRSPIFRDCDSSREAFREGLQQCPSVTTVRVDSWASSAVVEFDCTATDCDAIIAAAQDAVGAPPIPEGKSPRSPHAADSRAHAARNLLLSSASLVAHLLGTSPLLQAALLLSGVFPIARRAYQVVREEHKAGIDALDATAEAILLARGEFFSGAVMATLIASGEYIREATARRSDQMVADLEQLLGYDSAWLVRGRRRERVPVGTVKPGDVVVVYPGEPVPVDGRVLRGSAALDQKSLTGEAEPRDVGPHDRVFAASIAVEGKIYVVCDSEAHETRAAHAIALSNGAGIHDRRAENYARRADRLVLPTFGAAIASWGLGHDAARAASVLIVDFATGVRIAAPTALLATLSTAARRGVLIKGGGPLEKLARVDAIVFDKTGTLTRGQPALETLSMLNGHTIDEMLAFAAGAEQRFRHPAARAILRRAAAAGVAIPERSDSRQVAGMGVEATVGGRQVLIGSEAFVRSKGFDTGAMADRVADARHRGESLSFVGVDRELWGFLGYTDPVRTEAHDVVRRLRRRGVKEIIMVTGDHRDAAIAAGRAAGIDQIAAEAFPDDKVRIVNQLKAYGHTVAVIGDGINDSPALAHADVAISLHGSTAIARERADIVLTDDTLLRLPEAIDLARNAMGLVNQAIRLTAVTNGLALVAAATGLIGPRMATLANNGSAVLVSLNSLRPLIGRQSLPLDL